MEKSWFLESIASDGSHLTHPIRELPFRIGRDVGNELIVAARGLSRRHAEIHLDAAGQLCLSDLGSTNGTFLNRERIGGPRPLAEDDVIHFGDAEYRVGAKPRSEAAADEELRTILMPTDRRRTEHFVREEPQFMELVNRGVGLAAAVQPIVDAHRGEVFAYELLGRCTHPRLQASPAQLFALAGRLGLEAELSAAFREHGVKTIASRLRDVRLFVNTHPRETFSETFFAALVQLRALPGAPELVLEVHESAVMELAKMRELAAQLADIGVAFAYDDFGAGQARLNELGEVPAHFVKFDMGLIRGLHEAPEKKQRVVRDLVRLVVELGSVPLAEGVEQQGEAELCADMGFRLLQGFLTGRPVLLQDWR